MKKSNPLRTPFPIEVCEWQLTHPLVKALKHFEFVFSGMRCWGPIHPQAAAQKQDGLTASVWTFVPALMTVKRSDAFAYGLVCLSNVDNRFVSKPSLSFVLQVEFETIRAKRNERKPA
jgi:hypothetical protein